MKRLSKKSLIIAIVLVAVILLSAGLTTIMLTVVFPVNPRPIVVNLVDLSRANQEYIELSWDKTRGAVGYVLEYRYASFSQEPKTVTLENNYAKIERAKGELVVRVRSLGKYKSGDSKFSEEYRFNIPAAKLNPIEQLSFTLYDIEDESIKEYNIDFPMATYHYNGVERYIYYYQIIIVNKGGSIDNVNPLSYNFMEIISTSFFLMDENDKKDVYVRAMNDKGLFGDFDGSVEGEPVELYKMYEPSDWTKITIE